MNAAVFWRGARAASGLTQRDLARRAGTSQPTLSAYERGAKTPSARTLRRLLAAARVRPSMLLSACRDEVLAACRAHGAADVRVFGSVARGEDDLDSDIDLLVRFRDGATLYDQAGLVDALGDLLGLPVDVVSEGALRLPDDQGLIDEARPL